MALPGAGVLLAGCLAGLGSGCLGSLLAWRLWRCAVSPGSRAPPPCARWLLPCPGALPRRVGGRGVPRGSWVSVSSLRACSVSVAALFPGPGGLPLGAGRPPPLGALLARSGVCPSPGSVVWGGSPHFLVVLVVLGLCCNGLWCYFLCRVIVLVLLYGLGIVLV